VLLSELDAADHTDALEIPLLPSSDVIVADVELDQRPHIGDSTGNGDNTLRFAWIVLLLSAISC
jgi:hypothetical protein